MRKIEVFEYVESFGPNEIFIFNAQPKPGRYTSDSPKSGAGQSMVCLPSVCHYWGYKLRSNWLTAGRIYDTTTMHLCLLYLAHISLIHLPRCTMISYLGRAYEFFNYDPFTAVIEWRFWIVHGREYAQFMCHVLISDGKH